MCACPSTALPLTRLQDEHATQCDHATMTAAVIATFILRLWADLDALLTHLSMVQAGNVSRPVVCSWASLASALPASGSASGRGSPRHGSMLPRLPPGRARSCSRCPQSPQHARALHLLCQSCWLRSCWWCRACNIACSVTAGCLRDLRGKLHACLGSWSFLLLCKRLACHRARQERARGMETLSSWIPSRMGTSCSSCRQVLGSLCRSSELRVPWCKLSAVERCC